jgi:hypothetical protein
MNPSSPFVTVSVGAPSPFPAFPPDQLTVMMTLAHPSPVVIVSLPGVNDEDIANVKAPPQAVALRRSAAMPAGALLLVLKVSDEEVWPICVPFLDDASTMRAWAMQTTDSNVALVVLVDAGTGIVRAQRTIGLPPRLLEMARQGILRTAHLDESAAIEELAGLSDQEVWEQGTCWQDKGDGVFTMVAEAPVLP